MAEAQKKEVIAFNPSRAVMQDDLAQILSNGVAEVMRKGPTAMSALERDFDVWVGKQKQEGQAKVDFKKEVLKTVNNARLAMESMYVRVQQSI